MKISVIIPTYKPKEYLWECLFSLKEQVFSVQDFEILLILNGPKEPFYSEIENFKRQYELNNLTIFYSVEAGVSNARNMGLDNAKGEYVTFIDDDDYVSSSYLEELYQHSTIDTITLAHPSAFIDSTGVNKKYSIEEEYYRCYLRGKQPFYVPKKFFQGPCMKLIHRDIIKDRRFNVKFVNGEDSLFMFLISNRFQFVTFTSVNATYYRRLRLGSANSNGDRMYRLKNSIRLIKNYMAIYISNPLEYNFYFFITRILGSIKSIIK